MGEIKILNVTFNYAVKWTIYDVMRDFIQNFFDSTGPEHFAENFLYEYKDEVLSMKTPGSFDYDWLCYIGVSSKRNKEKAYAGRYGEGFKIASLVAKRDFGFEIIMESQTWRLNVIKASGKIDGTDTWFLAYDISYREDDGYSSLTLKNVNEENYSAFKYVIKEFFYVGNPLLGKLIADKGGFAVYRCPENDPYNGVIFSGYQVRYNMRGYPFIISNPYYTPLRSDRDRPNFYDSEAEMCACKVVKKLNPEESFEMLELLKEFWRSDYRKNHFPLETLIRFLIDNIQYNTETRNRFLKKYQDSIVADFSSGVSASRKRTAETWFRMQKGKVRPRVVRSEFVRLGIPDIMQLCELNNGFEITRCPNHKESESIRFLEEIAKRFFADIIQYEAYPEYKIISAGTGVSFGQAEIKWIDKKYKTTAGQWIKMEIKYIQLEEGLFRKDAFSKALSTYMHELLHQLGKDTDPNFHAGLKQFCIHLLNNAIPPVYNTKWDSFWGDNDG